ncbi:MAG: hypothetical protein ACWA5L_05805 [bacterium]
MPTLDRKLRPTISRIIPILLTVFIAAVFLDSLRYKFTNHPNTQEIFGKLNDWAASWGADGLFAQNGIFSQYVIGTAELIASTMLIIALFTGWRWLRGLGALAGLGIMTGAISFHLFTPLGTEVNGDGGALFMTACGVWISSAILIFMSKDDLLGLIHRR